MPMSVLSALEGLKVDAPSLALCGGTELYTHPGQSREELRETIAQHADTIYHPVATCRMGSDPGLGEKSCPICR